MNSKERVLTTFNSQEADRVPVNYDCNPGIDKRLKEHFGLRRDDSEGLRQALRVDFRGMNAPYTGAKLHEDEPERGVIADAWGIRRRYIEHESGGYWDFCDFPLREADEQMVADWPLPSPDDHDYSIIKPLCEKWKEYACYTGHAGLGDIINANGMLRGMEQTLVDLITEDPAGMLLAKRRTDIGVEILRRTLKAADGGIDFVWMGEDLGTQIASIISPVLYRKTIRPLHQQIIDVAKSFDLPVMIHTCGSSSWAYEDFIEMGINVVDTLQPEAANMSPEYLKATFGGRLAFHGCISTGGPVATGTVEETIADCKKTMEIMMPGGGYCFAPTHQLQDNSPTENVVAMYQSAQDFGKY